MRDMNIRVQRAEEKWTKTEDKLAEALIDLSETKKAQIETKTILMKKDNELESEITRMRNPPYMHACGYKEYTNIYQDTIRYSTLLYSSTNTEGGGLDIASGVFTSSWAGSYTVSLGLIAQDDAGEHTVDIYLQHNG